VSEERSRFDRRELLRRAGGVALGASLAPVGLELVGSGVAAAGSDARLKSLAAELRGPVYARGSHGYDDARRIANLRYAGAEPLAVAQPETVSDVQACVRWARANDVRLVPRSGGHSYAGYCTRDGALQVDLRRMDGWHLDGGSHTARVGAGARTMQVYAGLADHGVTVPAGSCPSVGVAGLALGGGHGFAARRFGLTTDNVVEATVVLADGRRVRASATDHPDLFWACRGGGGGSFGIVTGFRFRVHSVHRASRFFAAWPWGDAADVLAAWQKWAPDGPDRLASVLKFATGHSQPYVHCLGQYFGSAGSLRDLIRPITRVGSPSVSIATEGYLDVQRWFAGCTGKSTSACLALVPDRFAAKSHYVRKRLPSDGRAEAVRGIQRAQALPGDSSLIMLAYGGAINRIAADATAFVHRDELFSTQFFTSWRSRGDDHAMRHWLRGFHAAMEPYASGFAYQNYIDPELDGWRDAYYGANWDRLVAVKAKYDPHDFFRFPRSIPTH
jgi:FAD/FMN-containing dehydrogenase